MRLLLLCLLFGSIIIASCSKENKLLTDKEIVGQWSWEVQHSPGGPALATTPQSTGINESIILNSDNSWSKVQNGTVIHSGTFKIQKLSWSQDGQIKSINFQIAGKDSITTYSVANDILTFGIAAPGLYGTATRVYKRL
jgi:hypothetical protein